MVNKLHFSSANRTIINWDRFFLFGFGYSVSTGDFVRFFQNLGSCFEWDAQRLWMGCFECEPNNRLLSRSSSHVYHVKKRPEPRTRKQIHKNYINNSGDDAEPDEITIPTNDHEIFSLNFMLAHALFDVFSLLLLFFWKQSTAMCCTIPETTQKQKQQQFCVCLLIVFRAFI